MIIYINLYTVVEAVSKCSLAHHLPIAYIGMHRRRKSYRRVHYSRGTKEESQCWFTHSWVKRFIRSKENVETSVVNQTIAAKRFVLPYIPLNPCYCKTLWCFIRAVHSIINRLRKYFLALAGLPCYLKKKILNIILDFYIRKCPKFLKKLIKAWVNYYINKWC